MTTRRRRRIKSELLNRDGRAVEINGTRYLYALCMWCKVEFPGPVLTIEHIIPFYEGGDWSMSNLGLACGPCNGGRNPHYKKPVAPPNAKPAKGTTDG